MSIRRRSSDNYVNILDFCPNASTKFSAYLSLESVKQFIFAFCLENAVSYDAVIEKERYNFLWVHPCIGTHFLCYLSPEYFVKVISWAEIIRDIRTADARDLELHPVEDRSVATSCQIL